MTTKITYVAGNVILINNTYECKINSTKCDQDVIKVERRDTEENSGFRSQ